MRILSFKPGHDGSVALVEDGELKYSLEAEKDSFPRYADVTPSVLVEMMRHLDDVPDVVCVSGWVKGFHSMDRTLEAGYFGSDEAGVSLRSVRMFGRDVTLFSSTHERSHLYCAYGMSPFAQGRPCYALVWEGNIGSFYEMDENANVKHLAAVLEDPGNKYQYLFALADPSVPDDGVAFSFSNAGKLMALAAYADGTAESSADSRLIQTILARPSILLTTPKSELRWSPVYNAGVESQVVKNAAARLSDAIFETFAHVARRNLNKGYPLLISGGCGLNCSWNAAWENSGLFDGVFVPPCANDSGSAIGTAVDAQRALTGNAKLTWNVYAGSEFEMDVEPDIAARELDYGEVAELLAGGSVLGWVQGRYEMGPRALGNRSILAAPFEASMRDRLNRIKQRDGYRPIAPVCLEEDAGQYFDPPGPSPHMLFFHRTLSAKLPATTHVDGSARAQTVRRTQNPELYDLLVAFRRRTGVGVLCNTSLNFNGRGFINRMSDLLEYAREHGLDHLVVRDRLYTVRNRE